jgi:SAM-dependent methyltransferase
MNLNPGPGSDPTKRFSNRVENYVRYRPGYPPAVLDCLAGEFGLTSTQVIADIGCGTGILTELLLRHGNTVFGVEPNAEMRAAAERLLQDRPGFHSVAGSAEETTLSAASVDWVTAGQAFHWFDVERAKREFTRILRGGGWAALLWNVRREDTPFLREYEQLLRDFGTDYAAVKHQGVETDGRLERFFSPRQYVLRSFDNQQSFDYAGLHGRTLSSSYVPAADHPRYPAMLAALRRLFERHAADGRVIFECDTRMYVGRLGEGT